MAITLQEIIDRSEQLALVGVDGFQSPIVDGTLTAQIVFPHALRYVLTRMASNGDDLHDVTTPLTINVAGGVGDLPDSVLKDALEVASFPGRPFVSWLNFNDYQRYKFAAQIQYFTFLGDKFYFSTGELDQEVNDDIVLNVAQIPAVPDDVAQEIPMSGKAAEMVITTIAQVLRGEMNIRDLI